MEWGCSFWRFFWKYFLTVCWRTCVWSRVQENRNTRNKHNNNISRAKWWSRRLEVCYTVKLWNTRAEVCCYELRATQSLKIMQSTIERHLKDNNYPLSIVISREFLNSQEVLNAKTLSLRQQGKRDQTVTNTRQGICAVEERSAGRFQ